MFSVLCSNQAGLCPVVWLLTESAACLEVLRACCLAGGQWPKKDPINCISLVNLRPMMLPEFLFARLLQVEAG